MRQRAKITSAQKKEIKSLKVPMGGTPGWLLRTAIMANSSAERKENIPTSILRPRSSMLSTSSRTHMAAPHIRKEMKSEKNMTVEEREMVMSMPT